MFMTLESCFNILSNMLLTLIVSVFILSCVAEEEQYTNKFDGVDIDKVLNSDRLLNNYHKCLLDKGPCTPAGAELKRNIPDALKTDCIKCTKVQREKTYKVTDFLMEKKPDMYKELEDRYDPKGTYRAKEAAKKSG